ncbi:MAG: hypothetical protein M3T55_00845 [Pseudomonadota bacterium]|nr:hypothetical protein [Pseudomonadota bacterium]
MSQLDRFRVAVNGGVIGKRAAAAVQDDEFLYGHMIDSRAIVTSEAIDAIRALSDRVADPAASIAKTSLGIGALTAGMRWGA